jgi:hypothetical protein
MAIRFMVHVHEQPSFHGCGMVERPLAGGNSLVQTRLKGTTQICQLTTQNEFIPRQTILVAGSDFGSPRPADDSGFVDARHWFYRLSRRNRWRPGDENVRFRSNIHRVVLSAMPSFAGGIYVAAAPFKPIEPTLIAAAGSNFKQGVNLLENAQRSLESGNSRAACNMLNAFTHQVQGQTGKSLTVAEANQLMFLAMHDRTAIGCR